ncbi:GvpL/GvpF family gas vesicle protein [Clostridium sp. ZS2-4]|uniref:GvpL/GvpF family gas vesicle protein n=1 Tax=Clostridium sp. ZS2-4 TaxID=2987703 RepID=UPI00227A5645|nr:GvpL/GvpF family gas vesicle protein [Clostridium sp. ZS2-4]MCY6354429.1 GvpL/GvpF family gas vesicle protein [Clostridium sp. ZS2-4]
MAKMGKYLYGFIKEDQRKTFGNSEIGNLNAPVYTVSYKDISAVMSDAPMMEYDPKRKNIIAHQNVLTKIMDKYTIIPVAFGTVASNKKDIETLMQCNYYKLINAIKYLEDKMEVGLKVTWKKDMFNNDIENKGIKKLKKIVADRDENEVLSEKIELGKQVEQSIIEKRDEYIKNIFRGLEHLAVESKLKDDLAIKTVFNAFFLIEKSNEDVFDKEVGEKFKKYEDRLNFSYTGPWPPYNFIDIDLDLSALKR